MTELSVIVIADSVSRYDDRITTLQCTFPRFLLPEFNTHRVFSRNSASSRARSVKKTIQEVREAPFVPWHWPAERPGMAGGDTISASYVLLARDNWTDAASEACNYAERLVEKRVHKSIVNRLLEPFMWHTVVVTATDWDNFFAQRLALLEDGRPAAEPHFYDLACEMRRALDESQPTELPDGNWHVPYVSVAEQDQLANTPSLGPWWLETTIKLSVARCAGVSYLNQDALRPWEKDLALYDKLRGAAPPHWSPFEHVARPHSAGALISTRQYNLTGWASLRWHLAQGATLGDL